MWKRLLKFLGRCPDCHGWNVSMFGFCFDCGEGVTPSDERHK